MRIRRSLLVILTPPTLAAFAGLASAQQKTEDKSRPAGTERNSVDKAPPVLTTGKVTRVDERAARKQHNAYPRTRRPWAHRKP